MPVAAGGKCQRLTESERNVALKEHAAVLASHLRRVVGEKELLVKMLRDCQCARVHDLRTITQLQAEVRGLRAVA